MFKQQRSRISEFDVTKCLTHKDPYVTVLGTVEDLHIVVNKNESLDRNVWTGCRKGDFIGQKSGLFRVEFTVKKCCFGFLDVSVIEKKSCLTVVEADSS